MAQIHFHRVLRQRIEEVYAAEAERICQGKYTDLAVYREQVGYLRALKAVLDLGEEIEKGLT